MRALFALLAAACFGTEPAGTDDHGDQTEGASTSDTGRVDHDSAEHCLLPPPDCEACTLKWKYGTSNATDARATGYTCPNGHHVIYVSGDPDELFETGTAETFVYDAEGSWIGWGTPTDTDCESWDNQFWEGTPALRRDCPRPTGCESSPCWWFSDDAPID
jgi:hypothetical protein